MSNEKKPFYKKWWFGLIVIVVIASFIFGGGEDKGPKEVAQAPGEKTEEPEKTPEEAEANQEEEILDKEFEIGEKIELDGHVVEVTKVEKSKGKDFDRPKEGKEFVIVSIRIENHANDNISYNPFDFSMQNSQGQIEDIAFTVVDSDTSLSAGQLIPGGQIEATVTFEEPIDDQGLKLIFKPSFWNTDQIVFNL